MEQSVRKETLARKASILVATGILKKSMEPSGLGEKVG